MFRLQTYATTATSLVALVIAAAPAFAQTQLPGIIVERPVSGATLERQPVSTPVETAPAPRRERQSTRPTPNVATDVAPAPGIALETIGSSVSVVTASQLRDQQIRHTADALRALPGVSVAGQGGPGSLTQVRIRGQEGRHTRVLVDGIELNPSKDGDFDFSNLIADDIERIEVIRGPMSGLYGSGALGGVINIVTRRPTGPLALIARTELGSFGTRDLALRLEGGNEKGYVSIGGQFRRIDGFNVSPFGDERDGTRIGSFNLKAGAAFAPNARLDLVLRLSEKRVAFDDFAGFAPGFAYVVANDAGNITRTHSLLAGATLAWDSLGGKLSQEIKLGHTTQKDENRFFAFTGFAAGQQNVSRDDSARTNIAYSATYRLGAPSLWGKHAITGRVEGEREGYRPFSDYGLAGFDGDGLERTRQRLSYAGELRSTFQGGLSTTLGIRHDDNTSFKDFTTWRAALSWAVPGTGLRPHASVGTGVKLPGMLDQFGPSTAFFIPNPALRPETSFGWDAGLEWTTLGGRLLLDATYFHSDLEDRIKGTPNFANFPITYTVENLPGRSVRQGVELSARYQVMPSLLVGAAYTYLDARDPDGLKELRRAPHSGRVDVTAKFFDGRLTTTLAAIYNGTRPELVFTPTFSTLRSSLDAAWLLQAAASYKLTDAVEIFGRVENALDVRYQEAYGYQTGGVAAYAGVRIRFEDVAGTRQR